MEKPEFIEDLLYKWRQRPRPLWIIQREFLNLKRALSWAKFMYSNQDWDDSFMVEVVKKKLFDMQLYIGNKGNHIHAKRDAKIICIAINHLERFLKDDSNKSLMEKFHNKYGETDMKWEKTADMKFSEFKGLVFSNCITAEQNDWANKVFMRCSKIGDSITEYHRTKAWDIIKKYHRHWWD